MVVVQPAGAAQQGAGLPSGGGVAEQSCGYACGSDDLKKASLAASTCIRSAVVCLTKSDSDVAPIRNSLQPGGGD